MGGLSGSTTEYKNNPPSVKTKKPGSDHMKNASMPPSGPAWVMAVEITN
jgi:hypothetical protein